MFEQIEYDEEIKHVEPYFMGIICSNKFYGVSHDILT